MGGKSNNLHKSLRKWARTPPPEPRIARTNELNDSGGGRKKGDKGLWEFCPRLVLQPGQIRGLLTVVKLKIRPPTSASFNTK